MHGKHHLREIDFFFCLKSLFHCSIEKSKCIRILEDGLEIWHVVLTCYLNHIFLSLCCLVKESWPSTEPIHIC